MPENPLQNPQFAAFVSKNMTITKKNIKLEYKYSRLERRFLPYSYEDNTADSIYLSIEYHPMNRNTRQMLDAPTIMAGLRAEGFIKPEEIRPIASNNASVQKIILERRDHTKEPDFAYSLSEIEVHPKHVNFRFIGKNLDELMNKLTFWLEDLSKNRNSPKSRL